MTEYAVTIVLKQIEVSAETPAEAMCAAVEKVAADVNGNAQHMTAAKLDRIAVAGLKRQ